MRHIRLLKATFLLLCLLRPPLQCRAAEIPQSVELTIGEGRILDFREEVTRVYTSNPEIADVVVIDSHEVVVNARAAGKATMAVWLQSGPLQSETSGEIRNETIPVTVTFDLAPIQKLLDQ